MRVIEIKLDSVYFRFSETFSTEAISEGPTAKKHASDKKVLDKKKKDKKKVLKRL